MKRGAFQQPARVAAREYRAAPSVAPIREKEIVRWVDNLVATTALLGESGRCVHIGDRETDIYEPVCAANDVGAHFVIRSAYRRLEAVMNLKRGSYGA